MERRANTLNNDDYEEVNLMVSKGYGSDQSFDPDEDNNNQPQEQQSNDAMIVVELGSTGINSRVMPTIKEKLQQ